MGYRVGSVSRVRPEGVVHRNVPSGSWSAFHLGAAIWVLFDPVVMPAFGTVSALAAIGPELRKQHPCANP